MKKVSGTKLISTYTAKHLYKIHLNSNFNNHIYIQPEHTCNLYCGVFTQTQGSLVYCPYSCLPSARREVHRGYKVTSELEDCSPKYRMGRSES
jgi:hypothetical protein